MVREQREKDEVYYRCKCCGQISSIKNEQCSNPMCKAQLRSYGEMIRPNNDFIKEQSTKDKQKQIQKQKKSGIEGLFDEPDKALILGLIMLLKSEGADESLIMALSYILS